MILKPVFKGVMEENAYNYITENFQVGGQAAHKMVDNAIF